MITKVLFFFTALFHFSLAQAEDFPPLDYAIKQEEVDKFLDPKFQDFTFLTGAYENQIRPGRQMWLYPNHLIRDDQLGMRNRPNTRAREIAREGEQIIYDSTLTIDEHSRRLTPTSPREEHQRFVLLIGCSFTFGQGLNDDQTLNAYMAKLPSSFYPYNYATQGTAPNTYLKQLMKLNPEELQPFEKGDMVYVHIPQHIDRAVGTWPSFEWMRDTPYFLWNKKGELQEVTTIKEGRPWRRAYIELLKRIRWLLNSHKIYPRISSGDSKYFCSLIGEMRDKFQEKFPEGRFVFYFHPRSEHQARMVECLEQKNIVYLKGSREGLEGPESEIPGDGHPSAYANELIARELVDFLEKGH